MFNMPHPNVFVMFGNVWSFLMFGNFYYVYQQKSGHTEKKNTQKTLTSIYIWRAELYICTARLYGLAEHVSVQFSSKLFKSFVDFGRI